MVKVSFELDNKKGNVLTDFNAMLSREAKINGYLNRVVYPEYQDLQQRRWISQGVSEGPPWKDLNDKYLRWRQKKFPNSGGKILVRTGDLARSVSGSDKTNHFKLVSKKRLEVGTVLEYAEYVDEVRDFTSFSDKTTDEIIDGLENYLVEGL